MTTYHKIYSGARKHNLRGKCLSGVMAGAGVWSDMLLETGGEKIVVPQSVFSRCGQMQKKVAKMIAEYRKSPNNPSAKARLATAGIVFCQK